MESFDALPGEAVYVQRERCRCGKALKSYVGRCEDCFVDTSHECSSATVNEPLLIRVQEILTSMNSKRRK